MADTVFNTIDATADQNLLMGGYSKDSRLVGTSNLRGIIVSLGSNGLYNWAKFLSVS